MVLASLIGAFLLPLAGCGSMNGVFLQRTRDGRPHVFRNRIASPDDYRYHERHATGIGSHVGGG